MPCLNKQHTLEQQPCVNATYGTGMIRLKAMPRNELIDFVCWVIFSWCASSVLHISIIIYRKPLPNPALPQVEETYIWPSLPWMCFPCVSSTIQNPQQQHQIGNPKTSQSSGPTLMKYTIHYNTEQYHIVPLIPSGLNYTRSSCKPALWGRSLYVATWCTLLFLILTMLHGDVARYSGKSRKSQILA